MLVVRQVEIPFHRDIGKQCGRGFPCTSSRCWENRNFFLRKYIVPAAKREGADSLEFAAAELAEFISGRKNFQTAAKM